MKKSASILRVYVSETDMIGDTILYDQIVKDAHMTGLAGATVLRGIISFGASHSIHSVKVFSMTSQVPIIIEIVDDNEVIREFSKQVQTLIDKAGKGALMTIQPVEVIEYKAGNKYNQFSHF